MRVRISRPEAASSTTVSAISLTISACRRRMVAPDCVRDADRGTQIDRRVTSAGSMPKSTLVSSERRSVNASTRPSSGTLATGKKVFGQQQQQSAQREKAHRYAGRTAHECQQQVLDPELSLNLPARGAQRQPRGHFRCAPHHRAPASTRQGWRRRSAG